MGRNQPTGSSLTQDAYERLRADLLACRIKPGARLKIAELCESLTVSLSAVREALARLMSEGLVVGEPQKGFCAAPISPSELQDLTGVRIRIETACLERAIAVGDVAWESHLVSALHRLSRTPERATDDPDRLSEAWAAAHADYHTALAAACDSPWLLKLREMLYDQSERYRRLSIPLAEVARDIGAEHRELVDAALDRDAIRAVAMMTRHLETTTLMILDNTWSDPAPSPASGGRIAFPRAGRGESAPRSGGN
jgi:DNA-binding GntR family transcriptional regulator